MLSCCCREGQETEAKKVKINGKQGVEWREKGRKKKEGNIQETKKPRKSPENNKKGGQDRDVQLSDKDAMPYVDAVMWESLRHSPIVGIPNPHCATKDTKICKKHKNINFSTLFLCLSFFKTCIHSCAVRSWRWRLQWRLGSSKIFLKQKIILP